MKDNQEQSRFENEVEGRIVFANYRREGNVVSITYVEAPPELRGSGAAGALMQDIVDDARAKGYKLYPICGYAVSWLRRHDEYNDLLA